MWHAPDKTVSGCGRRRPTRRASPVPADITLTITDDDENVCARTTAILDAIMRLIVPGANDCSEVTLTQLADIIGTLALSNLNISSLAAGDFDGLTALTALDLGSNDLASLPNGIFDELTALTVLDLGSNDLASLPVGIFDKLTALTELDLSFNDLASRPAGIFGELHVNDLASLPDDIFEDLTELSLDRLFLDGNSGAPFKPVVSVGADLTVNAGSAVSIPGSVTGPWGDHVRWSWVQVDGPVSNTAVSEALSLTSADTGTPSFTAPMAEGSLYFRVVSTPGRAGQPSVSSGHAVSDPDWITIVVEAAPTVTLALTSTSISENGGSSTVTASLDRASGVETTITVSATPGTGASTSDYMLSSNATLTIAQGETTSTGTVTITAVDNDVDAPDKTVSVAGAAFNSHGVSGPADVTLTITDDDEALRFVGSIEDQNYPRAQPITSFALPEAVGGLQPIKYTLTPTLLTGLHFDPLTRVLSGTPTVVTSSPVQYTYTATDANGVTSQLTFNISVYSPVSIETGELPEAFTVVGNYPNPFQTVTQVAFHLPWSAGVRGEVIDLIGRRVLTIQETRVEAGWTKTIQINGASLPPGTYLYRLMTDSDSGNSVQVGRLVRIR